MSTLSPGAFAVPPPADRRLMGLAVTLLVHAALIVGWQMARTAAPVEAGAEPSAIQWLRLPAPARRIDTAPAAPPAARPPRARPAANRPARATPPAAAQSAEPEPAAPSAITTPAPAETPPVVSGSAIMESARRSVGSIDRALRKENRATIVAPPDSPQIRMREGMEQAHALAPPRLWEAPKVEELVNNTGDGARRSRVITGNGTYCITERSPATSIDMIEKHGKQRFTSCPKHETPAKKQVWRTARD